MFNYFRNLMLRLLASRAIQTLRRYIDMEFSTVEEGIVALGEAYEASLRKNIEMAELLERTANESKVNKEMADQAIKEGQEAKDMLTSFQNRVASFETAEREEDANQLGLLRRYLPPKPSEPVVEEPVVEEPLPTPEPVEQQPLPTPEPAPEPVEEEPSF